MGLVVNACGLADSVAQPPATPGWRQLDLVAVLEGSRVVGVVLMTNIFDLVAQFVMEHGGGPETLVREGGDND